MLQVGNPAPDFVLYDLDGVRDTSFLTTNFWGIWCEPCKKEMPAMGRQYDEFKDQRVQTLAVNIAESEFKVQKYVSQFGMTFPTLIDKSKNVMEAYNIRPLPTTILINPEGKIDKIITGEMSEIDIRGYMESIKP